MQNELVLHCSGACRVADWTEDIDRRLLEAAIDRAGESSDNIDFTGLAAAVFQDERKAEACEVRTRQLATGKVQLEHMIGKVRGLALAGRAPLTQS